MMISYAGKQLTTRYNADFLCYDSIIVELKALSELVSGHQAQTIHYLKATGCERGLLVNFGAARLEYKRFVLFRQRGESSADDADVRWWEEGKL
jgi:GxxExxY protein